MIDEDIFERVISQYRNVVEATRGVEDNHVIAMNRALSIDSQSIADLGVMLSEHLKHHYPEDLQMSAAAIFGLQVGILAGRQEAIENTGSG